MFFYILILTDSSTSLPDVVLGTIPYSPFYSMSDSGFGESYSEDVANSNFELKCWDWFKKMGLGLPFFCNCKPDFD